MWYARYRATLPSTIPSSAAKPAMFLTLTTFTISLHHLSQASRCSLEAFATYSGACKRFNSADMHINFLKTLQAIFYTPSSAFASTRMWPLTYICTGTRGRAVWCIHVACATLRCCSRAELCPRNLSLESAPSWARALQHVCQCKHRKRNHRE
jgi:hypothetical protein